MQTSFQDRVYEKLLLFIVTLTLVTVELFIPRLPLIPWLKIGLPNIITIIWIIRFGYKDAILFSLLRVWITTLFFGFSIFSIALGLSGSFLSISMMWLTIKLSQKWRIFGFVGIGIIGAFSHNIGQLIMLKLLIGKASLVHVQLPLMGIVSIVTGTITGILAYEFNKIAITPQRIDIAIEREEHLTSFTIIGSLLLLLLMVSLTFITSFYILLPIVLLVIVLSLYITRGEAKLLTIRRMWLLLTVIFITTYITSGRDLTIAFLQLLRMIAWLESVVIFRHLNSDRLLFASLKKVFKGYDSSIIAAILTVEVVPLLMSKKKKVNIKTIQSPTQFIATLLEDSEQIIEELYVN